MPELPEGYQHLEDSERHAAAGASLVGPADPAEALTVTIALRRKPAAPELPDEQYWADTPPAERTYLSRDTFADTYGAAPDDVEAVTGFARANGLEVEQTDLAQRIVRVSGTTARVSQAFGVELAHYETAAGRYRGREGFISVPAELTQVIEGVFGLDNRQVARRAGGGGVITPVTPPQVAALYDFPQPASSHIGRETIGLLEFSDPTAGTCGYNPADIADYFTTNLGIGPGYATPVLTDVGVNGATNTPGGPGDPEVALDIEVAGVVAQGARIAVYFTTWDENGWVLALKRAVHPRHGDPRPSVLSISWGWAELHGLYDLSWSRAAMHAVHDAFREAAAFGVTVLVASGDDGSNCQVNDGHAHVYYPQSDPWVSCCGGTTIENVAGSSFDEVTWNDNGITGGGISDVFDLPFWQKAAGVPPSVNPGSRVGRGIPDIAGYANGYSIVFHGANQGVWWGTSETAPLYAGLIAVINSRLEHRVGYLNPVLYALGGTPVFRDIDDGGSNAAGGAPGYTAGPGWDACTGWGSVNGHELLHALRRRRDHH
jgi:subtilase family serine protease